MEEFGISPAVQKLVRATRDVVPDIYQYMVETKNCAEKINVFLADLSDKEILREELSSVEGLAISSSMYNNLEIKCRGGEPREMHSCAGRSSWYPQGRNNGFWRW